MRVIGLLVFATVFQGASAFNGDINQWDVAKVSDLYWWINFDYSNLERSKSIRIVLLLCFGGFRRAGVWGQLAGMIVL